MKNPGSPGANPTRCVLKPLEEPYRSRAVPPGSARYWSWFFAATEARAPLLGIYALLAEWRALMDPNTEPSVARIKLAWWRDEMQRLCDGSALHPISFFLLQLPRAVPANFTALVTAIEAAAIHVAGAPLEHAGELESHGAALFGGPLAIVGTLGTPPASAASQLHVSTSALAAGDYLLRAIEDYAREARVGRVSFPVDELLAAGIEDSDLAAAAPPAHLQTYLHQSAASAARYFEAAIRSLPREARSPQRHLLVLASLSLEQLRRPATVSPRWRGLKNVYTAWATARRAAATS